MWTLKQSLAGISERMVLIPDLMPFEFDIKDNISKLLRWTADKKLGSIILVSSDEKSKEWESVATIAKGSSGVEKCITELQEKKMYGPIVFANRYDGIDLPGDSCRLLVMNGLPSGTSNYELFRASALFGGNSITKMLAQRIEQGIGRGARGSGDFCVVLLTGSDLTGWVSKNANFNFLTSATKAQLEMGIEISKEVHDLQGLADVMKQSYERNRDWIEYHAEILSDLIDNEDKNENQIFIQQAKAERKALRQWQDGYHQKAIAVVDSFIVKYDKLDEQTKG